MGRGGGVGKILVQSKWAEASSGDVTAVEIVGIRKAVVEDTPAKE